LFEENVYRTVNVKAIKREKEMNLNDIALFHLV